MNLRRALARDIRYSGRPPDVHDRLQRPRSASSTGHKTPSVFADARQVESPPPTQTAKPVGRPDGCRPGQCRGSPARCSGTGRRRWCTCACAAGSEYSRLPKKKAAHLVDHGVASNSSSPSMPATGQPVMLRTLSPQAPAVVSPAASRISKISGSSASSIQWSWMYCRVVSSP